MMDTPHTGGTQTGIEIISDGASHAAFRWRQRSPKGLKRGWALGVRLTHVAIALALAAPPLVALTLTPDPSGLGTHRQILVLPCSFQAITKLPCPTCGMTTAFAHMAHGHIGEALLAQPMGALGFALCVLLLPVALVSVVSGRNTAAVLWRLPWERLSWIVLGLFGSAWIFKLALTLYHWA